MIELFHLIFSSETCFEQVALDRYEWTNSNSKSEHGNDGMWRNNLPAIVRTGAVCQVCHHLVQ